MDIIITPGEAMSLSLASIPADWQPPVYEWLLGPAANVSSATQASVIVALLGNGASYGANPPPTSLSFPADHALHLDMGDEWYWLQRQPDRRRQRRAGPDRRPRRHRPQPHRHQRRPGPGRLDRRPGPGRRFDSHGDALDPAGVEDRPAQSQCPMGGARRRCRVRHQPLHLSMRPGLADRAERRLAGCTAARRLRR